MKYPAHLLTCALAAALGLAHTGCTTLLQADFDADTVGAVPNSSPPGYPAGDRIYSIASSRVVYNPTLASRSLRFRNGEEPKSLLFVPENASPGANVFYASWKGLSGTADAPLDLWLTDIRLSRMGGIRLDRGVVKVRTGGERFETLGKYQRDAVHAVLFTADRTAGTFSVHFYQGSTTLSRTGLPLETITGGAITPMLVLVYAPGGDAVGSYVCDDVLISERKPRKAGRKPVQP